MQKIVFFSILALLYFVLDFFLSLIGLMFKIFLIIEMKFSKEIDIKCKVLWLPLYTTKSYITTLILSLAVAEEQHRSIADRRLQML